MKRAKYILAGSLLTLLLFFAFEKSIIRAVAAGSATPPKNVFLLEAVIRLIKNDYIEEKDAVKTMDGSFQGLVNSLDSTSSYLNKESTARYLDQKGAQLSEPGIGLFKEYGGFPQVVGIAENSPAEKSALRVGDLITEIEGLATPSMSLTEVNLYIRDKADTTLNLKVLREADTLDIKVERALLFADPVQLRDQEGTSGVLQVVRLDPPCVSEIKTKLWPNLAKRKKILVVDLRNCQDGSFEEAQQFINLFLKAENFGYLEKKGGTKEPFSAPEEAILAHLPLVIWTNQATMGPAEAVAAVLKNSKRAKIVGLPTAGLAAKHQFILLGDQTSVILTSGIFCLNSGEKVWGRGAEPDVRVDMDEQSFDAFMKKTKSLLSSP
jgi:carboxyl-terminal processing protease